MLRKLGKKTLIGLTCAVIFLALGAASCGTDTTPTAIQSNQDTMNNQLSLYNTNQPVPMFDYSLPRDVMIKLLTAENEVRSTYSYIVPYGNGRPIFGCASIGFPIPGGTQLTNPSQPVWNSGGTSYAPGGVAIGLMEPNGLYPPSNAEGTYFMCVRKNGDIVPEYAEDHVDTFAHPVKWDPVQGMFVDDGGTSGITLNLDTARATHVVTPQAAQQPTPVGGN